MQAGPGAQLDSPLLTRGALLMFQDEVPSSPEPFQIRFPRPRGSTLEGVGVFDDYDAECHNLRGLRCKAEFGEVICWLRREGDAFRIIMVDPGHPSMFR
jgi:hypothetical protein